jgi:hypothetical protein
MSEWQPIETAPRDGTEIIGIYFREWEGMSTTVYGPWTVAFRGKTWRSSWDGSEVISSESDFGTEYKEPDCDPTHWMPMPGPPK